MRIDTHLFLSSLCAFVSLREKIPSLRIFLCLCVLLRSGWFVTQVNNT